MNTLYHVWISCNRIWIIDLPSNILFNISSVCFTIKKFLQFFKILLSRQTTRRLENFQNSLTIKTRRYCIQFPQIISIRFCNYKRFYDLQQDGHLGLVNQFEQSVDRSRLGKNASGAAQQI